tara:strand:+ start:3317 stop:3826 length:510 start_codon:yes stop_codon:yes gene_type:complete
MVNVGNLLVKRNKTRIALGIQVFSVDEFKFEVMPLSPSNVETLECHETYEDMIFYAADNGVVINNSLMSDDVELADRLAEFWAEHEESGLRQRVGNEVCELSGLTTYLGELLETEEDAKEQARITKQVEAEMAAAQAGNTEGNIVDGDKQIPHISLERLTADQGYTPTA